ncbi:polymeric immunoglobulin receptor-like [Conger conger]|uniref:polymeric immunoglobulin receptor-like n=1 Tax=Conger conger TaxID=82655 RepID=UPI002A5AEB9E|nr:polymeric immunoglobulin receptor-like [Conger conger]
MTALSAAERTTKLYRTEGCSPLLSQPSENPADEILYSSVVLKVKGETSITDDPTHHVFTVTMRKLKMMDSGYYWCAVEIQGAGDKGTCLYLTVTADTPGLWVEQQEVAGVEGGHVSVPCHYSKSRSMKKWCRIKGSCVEVNSGESGRSEMKDDRSKKVFTVTVRELNMEDTGWYWCAAGEQIPVRLTVTQKTTMTTVTTHLTIILMAQGMLLLVAAVATVTWKLCKDTPSENPADEVLYSSVVLKNLQHMALTLILFLSILFLTVLPDADGVYTMSKVAVQRGRSVTIPCPYDREYYYHVKYWCRRSDKNSCATVVRTDSPTVKGETSITDDPTHHVFTVTMRKLQMMDSGYYWCAVEIQRAGDKRAYLHLSVTADIPGLWVEQQEVAGVEGGHVSVPCHYNEPSSMKKWCRIEGSCVEVNSGESIKYGRSEMKDDRSKKVFTVTVRELNMEDTGWYWCAAGELQVPVHLTTTTVTTRTLWVLRHTGLVLVFLICTAVAFWKIWQNRRVMQSRENRRHRTLRNQNNADVVSL